MAQLYDIYANKDFKWKVSNEIPNDNTAIPYITLFEYDNKTDNVAQEMIYLRKRFDAAQNLKEDKDMDLKVLQDIYSNLYKIEPTNTIYRLPYTNLEGYTLDTSYRQIEPRSSTIGGDIQSFVDNIWNAQYNLGNQWDSMKGLWDQKSAVRDRRRGAQIAKQTVKTYDQSQFGNYTTTFNLINKSPELAQNHYKFIRQMLKANVPSFANVMFVKVPVLYQINIPGLHHIPLGFISYFTAKPQGAAYLKNDGGERYAPAIWEINMTFNAIFPISKQLLELDSDTAANDFLNSTTVNESKYTTEDFDYTINENDANPAPPQDDKGQQGGEP